MCFTANFKNTCSHFNQIKSLKMSCIDIQKYESALVGPAFHKSTSRSVRHACGALMSPFLQVLMG